MDLKYWQEEAFRFGKRNLELLEELAKASNEIARLKAAQEKKAPRSPQPDLEASEVVRVIRVSPEDPAVAVRAPGLTLGQGLVQRAHAFAPPVATSAPVPVPAGQRPPDFVTPEGVERWNHRCWTCKMEFHSRWPNTRDCWECCQRKKAERAAADAEPFDHSLNLLALAMEQAAEQTADEATEQTTEPIARGEVPASEYREVCAGCRFGIESALEPSGIRCTLGKRKRCDPSGPAHYRDPRQT